MSGWQSNGSVASGGELDVVVEDKDELSDVGVAVSVPLVDSVVDSVAEVTVEFVYDETLEADEVMVSLPEVLGAGVGSGLTKHEHAEETRIGSDLQFEICSGRPVVAVNTAVVYVAQKLEPSGKWAVFSKARRQLSGWQSELVITGV